LEQQQYEQPAVRQPQQQRTDEYEQQQQFSLRARQSLVIQ
jgi:hypothetical protein